MNTPSGIKGYIRDYGEVLIAAALFLLQILLISFPAWAGSHRLLFLFFFFNMALFPGFLLTRSLFGRSDLPVTALMTFVSGTALTFAVLIVFTLFDLNIYLAGFIMPGISLVIALLRKICPSLPTIPDIWRFNPPPASSRTEAILFILLLFVVILIVSSGDPMFYTSDSADHIAYIGRVSDSGSVFPDQYLYRDGGLLTRDIRKGLYHGVWGAANLLTGNDNVIEIWPLIAAISSTFIILALYCAGRFIFGSSAIGLLAAFIFVFIHGGGLTTNRLITAAYSFPMGRTFSIVFLFSILSFLKDNRKAYLILMGASALAATGTHIAHIIVIVFIIFVVLVGKLIESSASEGKEFIKKTAPRIAAVAIGVNIPYLLIRYLRDYAPNNPIHTHLQGIFRITENLYTINPVVIFQQAGLLAILGFLSIFILWRQSGREENLRLLLWGEIAVWLILANPVLIPVILKVISYLVMRLKLAFPTSILAAVLIIRIADKIRGREVAVSWKGVVVGGAAVVIVIGYQLAVTPSGFAYSKETGVKLKQSCRNISDIFREIEKEVPDGSVIASDPKTSYCIPAFTDQFIVCTNGQHSIPNDSTALRRILDCRDIFSPVSSLSDIADILTEYEVGYIVVNGRLPGQVQTLYWNPDRGMAMEAIRRFSAYPKYFKLLYRHDHAAIFEVSERIHEGVENGRSSGNEFAGREVKQAELSDFTPSELRGIYIKSVKPLSNNIRRGQTLKLRIEWVAARKFDYGSYISHIRFDTDYERDFLYSQWYSKIYRKILEGIRGYKFRFRYSGVPTNGMFTPEKWPPMQVVTEALNIKIPGYITPGEYTISVKMAKQTAYPNYSLRDLINDDDRFDGPDFGRITIE